jgi:hypothetical protein
VPNLQVINKAAHLEKCADEAAERATRRSVPAPQPENEADEAGL